MQPINRDSPRTHNYVTQTASTDYPTLIPPDVYANRPFEEQETQLNHLDTNPYIFPSSRSISPTSSTPPSSSSSASLTSPFQFPFNDGGSNTHDRPDHKYRSADLTLHGLTADISLPSAGSDDVRHGPGARRVNYCPSPLLPSLPQFSGSDNSSHRERGSSEGEATPCSKPQPHRGHSRESRSPSPGAPPISGGVAVIKAQAFGALRRTRAKTKKTSEGSAKVAMEVLEARDI